MRLLGHALLCIVAWSGIAATTLFVKLAGFRRVHALVRRWPVRNVRRRREACEVWAAIDAAARFALKPIQCLERAVITACMLRTFGHPAEMVVGVQRVPFYAHAWVELDGRIITDPPERVAGLAVVERC